MELILLSIVIPSVVVLLVTGLMYITSKGDRLEGFNIIRSVEEAEGVRRKQTVQRRTS